MISLVRRSLRGGKTLFKDTLRVVSLNLFPATGFYYCNWWGKSPGKQFWYARFISHRFNLSEPIVFFSCFGRLAWWAKYIRPAKIFFTGENLQSSAVPYRSLIYGGHLLDIVGLGIGFEFRTEPNYLRFPQWISHRDFVSPTATLEDIRAIISRLNAVETRASGNRSRFIAQVSSHDQGGQRGKLIDLLDSVGDIHCAGKFRNNTDELQSRYEDVKEKFLSNYKFNICVENSLGEGYITEKIFESIASGCIPIYWGAYLEPGILNPEAILLYEEGKEQELYDKVKLLWEDEEAYQKFIEIPPFVDGAAERIWEMMQALEKKLSEILK